MIYFCCKSMHFVLAYKRISCLLLCITSKIPTYNYKILTYINKYTDNKQYQFLYTATTPRFMNNFLPHPFYIRTKVSNFAESFLL